MEGNKIRRRRFHLCPHPNDSSNDASLIVFPLPRRLFSSDHFCSDVSLPAIKVRICRMIPLKDISPAATNNINTKFILSDKGKKTMEGQNMTCLTLVADDTAAVHFQLWGEDECDAFQPGDIILLTNGIFSFNRSNLVLRAGKRGWIDKVGEFIFAYVETPNMSEIQWVTDSNNSKKFVQKTHLSPYSHIFPPQH